MSEDKLEEKYLGNAKLSQKPERKLVLRLGKDAVKEENIKDGAVTMAKLGDDITSWLAQQVQDIKSGAIYFKQDLGDGTGVGISQDAITKIINEIRTRLDGFEDTIIPFYWGSDRAQSHTVGKYYYDPETEIFYKSAYVKQADEEGNEYETLEWVPFMTQDHSLYFRLDTLGFYKAAGTDGALYPYYETEVYCGDIGNVDLLDPKRLNAPLYIVYDYAQDSGDKLELGTLTIFISQNDDIITQVFTTPFEPKESAGNLYWDGGASYGEYPKTYFRSYNFNTGNWTNWHELSAHIDVDNALDPTHTSENPVMNKVLTAKFEEVQEILDGETKIRYFDAYDETSGVVYSDINYTGSEGSIVYMVSDNKFALRDGTNYYLNWTVNGTRDGDQTEYNKDGKAREDRNFILLTNDNTFSTTLDDKLSLNSDHAVRNSVITTAINKITPLIVEYYTPTTQGDGTITATIRERYSYIKDSYFKGKSIFIRRSLNYQDANISGTIDNSSPAYWVTQFTIDNNDEAALVCYAIGEDGQYRMKIPKNIINGVEQPTSISITKVEGNQSSSINGSSIILFNDLEDRNLPVANTDGSIWYYYSKEDLLEGVFRLSRKKNRDTQTLEEVTPNEGIIYVDVNKKLFYRWANNKFESIGGGGNSVDFDDRISALENLLGLYYTEENGNKVYNLRNIQNLSSELANISSVIGLNSTADETYIDTEGESHLTVTARLVGLESNKYNYLTEHQDISGKANAEDVYTKVEADATFQPVGEYLTEHQDLSNYATKNDLDTKADKGHSVIILSFYTDIEPSISDQSARNLNANMPNGIYWLDPYGTNNKFLHKGTYSEEYDQIIWNNREPSEEELLSEETLYVYKANKKMYLAKKTTNDNVDSWQIIEASSTSSIIPATIEVNTDTVSLDYASNLDGVQFKCKPFTVNPEECEVSITVNGEPYEENMLLSANNYTVTYSIANPTKYVGNSVSYEVEVTQSQEIEQVFDFSVGNVGKLQILKEDPQNEGTFIPKKPEEITVNDVKAYNGIPELYSEYKITKDGQSVYPTYEDVLAGTISIDTPHLFTADEIGLQYLDISSISASAAGDNIVGVGKQNVTKIRQALENENCIGFKLTEIYFIYYPFWLKNGNGNNIQVSSGDNNVSPSYYSNPTYNNGNTIINISKDFIIDGEVEGEAVGGFESGNLQGAMFYTEHSLKLNKVHISCAKYYVNTVPCFYINCSNGINQLCVTDSIFDRNKSYPYTGDDTGAFIPSGEYIGLYFKDEDPIDNQGYAVANNYIEHVYICGCDFEGGSISDLARTHRVTKSFRIVSNSIHDVTKDGITFSTWNELTYENKMSYMSCPIYIIDNIISGMNSLKRDGNVNNYYTAILIESAVLYILRNEIKNFVCSSTNPDTAGACIYDSYFNGKQLYYANNIVSNIIRMNKKKINSGILKSKGVGYNVAGSPNSLIPPIRYYKDNKFLLNPSEITTMWNNRTPLGNQTYITTENNTDINELMSIMFESPVDIAFKDLTISGNLFNALWDGDTEDYESIDSSKTGNITGKNYNMKWTVANGYIEDNTFIATRMSSEEWGYTHDTGTSTGNTYLFGFAFNNLYNAENESTRLIVTGNDFTVYNNTPENIQFYDLVYNSGQIPLSEAKPQIDTFENNTINGSHCIKANYWNGATVRPSLWHKESNE